MEILQAVIAFFVEHKEFLAALGALLIDYAIKKNPNTPFDGVLHAIEGFLKKK